MTTQTGGRIGSRWGFVAQVVAMAGILLCIGVLVAIWLGRGVVQGGLDDVNATVDRGFQRGIDATTAVSDRIDAATAQLEGIVTDARALAESRRQEPGPLIALQQRLGDLADGYRTLRIRYAEVRENVLEAMASVQRITRIVPGVSVPEGPGEALAAVDARLQDLDERITDLWPRAGEEPPVGEEASRAASAAAAIREAVDGASAAVQGLSSRLESAQARATDGIDRVGGLVVIGALAASLVFVWVLLLNVALWWLGHLYRERGRGAGAAVAPTEPPASA